MIVDVKNINVKIKKYWTFKKREIKLKTAHEELESLIKKSLN